jgi:hypothetical protein
MTTKQYKIRDGFSFKTHDDKVLTGGEIIELAADIAAQHLHKLEELTAEVPEPEPEHEREPGPVPGETAEAGAPAEQGAQDDQDASAQ